MRQFKEITAGEFHDFINESYEHEPLFASKAWIGALNQEGIVFFGNTLEDRLISVFVFEQLNKGPYKLLVNPYFTPYSGPWTQANVQEELSFALKHLEKKHHDIQSHFKADDQVHNSGLKTTFTLDLTNSEEELWSAMSSDRQRNIKKAEKLGFELGSASVEELVSFYKTTAESQQLHFKYKVIESLSKADILTYTPKLIAGGKIVAAVFMAADAERAYYLGGGFDRTLKHASLLSSYLLWKSILWAKQEGIKVFDFEGSDIKGIAEFYRRFGAKKIQYLSSSYLPMGFKLLQKIKHKFSV